MNQYQKIQATLDKSVRTISDEIGELEKSALHPKVKLSCKPVVRKFAGFIESQDLEIDFDGLVIRLHPVQAEELYKGLREILAVDFDVLAELEAL